MTAVAPSLPKVLDRLRKSFGEPPGPPTRDAFELVLLENVAYLASPERRAEAFADLKRTVGTSPMALAKVSRVSLERITSRGILGASFAEKLRECAGIAIEEFGGDLNAALDGPVAAAKKALQRFPGIGEPGAEKILLFSGRQRFLAPDSNALRVLVRLGLVREQRSYAKTYAESRTLVDALPPRIEAVQEAHLLLQRHGQTLCKRNDPHCEVCPLQAVCVYAAARRASGGPRPKRVPRARA